MRCAACAAGAASDEAFQLYTEMRELGVPLEAQTFSALLTAYSAEVRATNSADRRTQLVLMERAFHLLDDMEVRLFGPPPPFNPIRNVQRWYIFMASVYGWTPNFLVCAPLVFDATFLLA